MTTKTAIKDFGNRIIGYIEEDPLTKMKYASDFYLVRLGSYNPKTNLTMRFKDNKIICKGDALISLIYAEDARQKAEKEAKKAGLLK